jgi:type IV pilus assembly protein PilC
MSAATYTFKAVDQAGTPEKGEISGISREAVTAELKARGLTVMDLVEKKTGFSMELSMS